MASVDILDKLTIIIPTFNRDDYLFRILNYLKQNYFNNIIIADSSSQEYHQMNERNVKNIFGDSYGNSISYIWSPEKAYASNFFEKGLQALKKVETPYTVFCGDTDFPITPGVRECLIYLEENQDFKIADGNFFRFLPNYEKRRILWIKSETNKKTISYNSPLNRIEAQIKNFSPLFYSIHSTNLLKLVFPLTMKHTNDLRFGEIFSSIAPLLHGKYANLDVDYWARELKPTQSSSTKIPYSIEEFWNNGTFEEKYKNFKYGLINQFPMKSSDEIDSLIDSSMKSFFIQQYPQIFGTRLTNCLNSIKKHLFGYLSESQKIELIQKIGCFYWGDIIVLNELTPEIRCVDEYLKFYKTN